MAWCLRTQLHKPAILHCATERKVLLNTCRAHSSFQWLTHSLSSLTSHERISLVCEFALLGIRHPRDLLKHTSILTYVQVGKDLILVVWWFFYSSPQATLPWNIPPPAKASCGAGQSFHCRLQLKVLKSFWDSIRPFEIKHNFIIKKAKFTGLFSKQNNFYT